MTASAGSMSSGDRDRCEESERGSLSRGFILLGLIGAAATTVAAVRVRRTIDWVYNQLKARSNSSSHWGENTGFARGSCNEQAQRRSSSRMQEEYEEEMERLERIRRMQSVFNRERSKKKKMYESWQDQRRDTYQQSPRNDWYWETDASFKDKPNFSAASRTPRPSGNYMWSHHYAVLGLDRSRSKPYSDIEIKAAFRAKAMEYHPDQNQENKETAEARFKEVLKSYEAIKSERNK